MADKLSKDPESAVAGEAKNDSPSDELDVAAQMVVGQSVEYSPEENKKVLMKIDLHLMPLCAWSCGLQFVDKSSLGAAATYGMNEDVGLHGQEYSWCVTIFYFGYLVGSFITGRCVQYFHAGKFIGLAFFCWGATLLGMLGANSFASIMVLRFLLGVLESSLVPGLLLVTTMWYTHREQPFRFGIWTLLNGALPVPFLVIYYGLGHVDSASLPPWRLIFLLLGLVSAVTGILLYLFLPDNPLSVKWLNDREKEIAVERVNRSQTGVKNEHFKWSQVREILTDYKSLLIVCMMFFSQAAGNVTTNFIGIVIKGFGYTALKAQLFTAPNYAVQAVSQIIVSAPPTFIHAFRNMKLPLIAFMSLGAVAGISILYVADDNPSTQTMRLGGCIIISMSGANYTQIMAVIGCNVGGFTKKQVVTASTFAAYCIVNIITPQTFLGNERPRYPTGLLFVLSFIIIFIILCGVFWSLALLENRSRDKKALTDPSYATGTANTDHLSGLRDDTDIQNKHHRYSP